MFYRLDALVLALSQHYRILKEIIKDRKGVTVYPSVTDAVTADRIADMIADIGGEGFANYCRLKFRQAYTLGDIKIYDIRKLLEAIRDNVQDSATKERLSSKLELFVELAIRLSNPISCNVSTRYRRPNKKTVKKEEQLLLFPELADPPETTEEAKEEKKPVRRRRKSAPRKPRATRTKRKTKIDKLADEIINAEYGNRSNVSDTDGDLDDIDESYREDQEDDVYNYYSNGYSRINGGEYDYFSGNYDND